MRVSITSILLAGGMLVLGACSTTAEPLTLAERTERCAGPGDELIPTGRQTGDARQDYRCERGFRHEGNRSLARASLNSAVDRSLRQGN
ncbi:hypothetical protein [Brevundimonas sp.]|uniref:hypothetical protein n=1 Tax=Brevundimonas sp. TaxID=1871086 RepID=UPI002D62F680|nr:hypothetical protein [Brevundimonas sp.]HYC68376.1 hypothetical protein [Brevundimonas sp.]